MLIETKLQIEAFARLATFHRQHRVMWDGAQTPHSNSCNMHLLVNKIISHFIFLLTHYRKNFIMNTEVLKVTGITCGGCVSTIEGALSHRRRQRLGITSLSAKVISMLALLEKS